MQQLSGFFKDIVFKARFVSVDIEENRFKSTVERFFKDWEKQVQKKLDTKIVKSLSVQKALEDLTPDEVEAIADFKVGSMPKRLASLAGAAAQKGVERAYTDMKMLLSWNIDMTPVADFYSEHYSEISKILSEEMQSRVKTLVTQAVREGSTAQELHQQIADIFAGPVTIKVPEKVNEKGKVTRKGYTYNMDKDRYTTMLARTEIQRALNNGRIYGYQQSNIAETVKWVANPSCCEFCLEKNGQEFSVEESQDLIPLHPNCRCTWVVSKYKKYEEETEATDKFADIDNIYADPNGVGIVEFFKLNDNEFAKVNDLIDSGKTDEALKILRGKSNG